MTQVDLGRSAYMVGGEDRYLVGVQDIVIEATSSQPIVYAATGAGGAGISSWSMASNGAARLDVAALPGGVQIGQETGLSLLEVGGQASLATTGVNDAGIWAFERASSGALSGTGTQPLSGLPQDLDALEIEGGLVFGTHTQSSQIEVWNASTEGQLGSVVRISSGLADAPSGIIELDCIQSGNRTFLLALTDGDDILACYSLADNGRPTLTNCHTMTEGVGIAAPSAFEVAQVGGRAYAVVAGRDSNSLSVFEVGSGGGLVATDHLIDTGDTRFGGAAHLAITTIGSSVFVAAAGNDDGVSLFQLLPGGRLLHLSTLADTMDTTLNNISALDMITQDDALGLAVASATEPGLTWISAAPGEQGMTVLGDANNATLRGSSDDDVLAGGAGNERLLAGGGDDVLMDGAGSDTLTGGDGADVFVFKADGDTDTISDFQLGVDRIDLSGWVFLRDISQLTFRSLADGGEIAFRSEVLKIETRAGTAITEAQFSDMSVLDGDRILPEWARMLNAETAADTGSNSADTITGGDARDILKGGGGADTVMAGAGDDHLDGGTGADVLNGGPGSDYYIIDHLEDQVIESRRWEGHDTVESSVSFWMRNAHVEDLTLAGDQDIRGIGNGLINVITGNSGNNILDGGKNNDTLIGGDGNDTYYVRAPQDTVIELAGGGADLVRAYRSMQIPDHVERMYLQGTVDLNGIGNEVGNLIVGNMGDNIIAGRGGRDTLKGLGGADTFVFDRAPGNNNVDRIIDFNSGEDALWIKAQLFGLSAGNVPGWALHFGTKAGDANDRFIFDEVSGGLWVDPDGTGPQRQMLTFVLEGDSEVTASDLLLF